MLFATWLIPALFLGQAPSSHFADEAGGFRVAFPGEPKSQETKVPGPAGSGELDVHSFVYEERGRAYLVSYNDYPAIDADKVGEFLDEVMTGSVQKFKGKLGSKRDIKLGTSPGKDYQYTIPGPKGDTIAGRSRIYLVGNRLYQLVLIGDEAFVKSKDANSYLDSFEITRAKLERPKAKPQG
ncbi:MAG: hypothetical protein U0800_08675 [Isosphaeraceae bacterium]